MTARPGPAADVTLTLHKPGAFIETPDGAFAQMRGVSTVRVRAPGTPAQRAMRAERTTEPIRAVPETATAGADAADGALAPAAFEALTETE